MADLSQLSDEEAMVAWTDAGKRVAEAQAECDAFAADHHRRLQLAEEQRLADKAAAVETGEADPALDQSAGDI